MNKINKNCGYKDKHKEKKNNNTGNTDVTRC